MKIGFSLYFGEVNIKNFQYVHFYNRENKQKIKKDNFMQIQYNNNNKNCFVIK